jgi:alkylhydroperoxidase family enzyme
MTAFPEVRPIYSHPRAPLAAANAEIFKNIESIESPGSSRVPNYLRAMAALPSTVAPFAHLIKTILYGGTIQPEIKLMTGFCIGQINGSPYATSYMERLLAASARGKTMMDCMHSSLDCLTEAERLAICYGLALTGCVWCVSDREFERLRSCFDESQVVELTLAVGFFNYFTRFCEALDLPVEEWAPTPPSPPKYDHSASVARIRLPSDQELRTTAIVARKINATTVGLGIGSANLMRAMARCSDLAEAWAGYQQSVSEYNRIGRELRLDIGFAVSLANDCRYCTLQQVLGLHRLGVDHAKLVVMKKLDEALRPSERVAVQFARKLTRQSSSITDDDYIRLIDDFTSEGALEVLIETCAFALMNRFTDGLHLPSEAEAVRVYRDVFGSEWTRQAR